MLIARAVYDNFEGKQHETDMTKRTIDTYSYATRIKNVFHYLSANLPLLGSDIRVEVTLDGSRFWHRNGVLHRDNGPAEELADGTRRWYRDGLVHRVGGPAIEGPDGFKSWWQNDILHRDDGPAIENQNGMAYWYRNGHEIAPPDGPEGVS